MGAGLPGARVSAEHPGLGSEEAGLAESGLSSVCLDLEPHLAWVLGDE